MNVPNGIPKEILPVMKNIIAAKTYTSFIHVIQQETGKTIGWEQVRFNCEDMFFFCCGLSVEPPR